LALVTFGFLIIDMMIRICVELNYFNFHWGCSGAAYGEHRDSSQSCVLGSFMFWCDLFSTGGMLFEISFFNKQYYETVDVEITLNKDGVPVSIIK
jgi:hypothetical protein